MTTGASQGRRRIAYVVFNDVYRDSRVLKMADSAADAGNDVRVFAFGGPLSHFAEGLESRESGAQILRLGVPVSWSSRSRTPQRRAPSQVRRGPAASSRRGRRCPTSEAILRTDHHERPSLRKQAHLTIAHPRADS